MTISCTWRTMRRMLFFPAVIVLLGLAASRAQGQEFLRLGESARGLGMGGALTAIAGSFDAMFYNPAGLALTPHARIEISYWREGSRDKDVTDGSDFFDTLDRLAGTSTAQVDAFLQSDGKKAQSARTQSFAGYHNETGFGAAYIETTRLSAPASPASPTQLDLTYDRISGGLFTLAYESDLKLLMWGVTVKFLERTSSFRTLSAADIGTDAAFSTEFGAAGKNEIDFDVGFIARVPLPFIRPTIGVALMNGNSPDFNRVTVQALERELNIAIAFEPDFLPDYMRLIITGEQRDSNSSAFPDEKSNRKREHLGAELSLFPYSPEIYWLHVRVGKSQGFGSFGIGVNLSKFATLDFVSYSEDVGTPGVQIRQQREMIQLKLGF